MSEKTTTLNSVILDLLNKQWTKSQQDKIQFSPIPKGQKGDLALSFFLLSKELKKSPIEIGKEVAEILKTSDLIISTEQVGPYLNISFAGKIFWQTVFTTPTKISIFAGKKIMVEFSGPNTNKPLHLGHMRNHALGIATSNLVKAGGGELIKVNIINDRGMHICKSMLAYQMFGNDETPESTGKKGDHFVGNFYVKFEQACKKDPTLTDKIQEMLLKWEQGDTEILALWNKMNQWTLSGHQETYKRQGVSFDRTYLESKLYLRGKKIAEMGLEKGIFSREKNGSIIINFKDKPKVILRSDGTSIYLTQDLAVAEQRIADFSPDKIIYITCDEQNYHFQVLFYCLEKLHEAEIIKNSVKFEHLSYGLVNLPHGRMKSREGTVVDADDLMDELQQISMKKIAERQNELSENEIATISNEVQNAAWKFYLLRTAPNKIIAFEPEKSIDFQGATGPYLQYAGVRIKSILQKAQDFFPGKNKWENCNWQDLTSSSDDDKKQLSTELLSFLSITEKDLGNKIIAYPQILQQACSHQNPTYIITYLIELAQIWSKFYAENKVLDIENPELSQARLFLAQRVLHNLEQGLKILGINIPKQM